MRGGRGRAGRLYEGRQIVEEHTEVGQCEYWKVAHGAVLSNDLSRRAGSVVI